jgi:hypothetical protein
MKRSSLQKIESKFTPKNFYEIDPWSQTHETFLCKFTHSFLRQHLFKIQKNNGYINTKV